MTVPVFAVVGHPNKGKSSIVSTLTRQDAVRISELSGTTTQAQAFQLNLNGQSQYELVDTPGFQRPRQVMQWLEQDSVNASQRPQAINRFLNAYRSSSTGEFHDEVELLSPIMSGAGIIYVVDGSLPYSAEYESEMTILQWTGQPRMALINPIGDTDYVAQWRQALSQYFSVVRVFDPLTADDSKQLAVLSAFAELHEPWRAPLERSIEGIRAHNKELYRRSARLLAGCLCEILEHSSSIPVPVSFAQKSLEQQLKRKYQQELRDIEARAQREMQALYAHLHLRTEGEGIRADYPDLFDERAWYLFGLDRGKLVALSSSAGAAAGVVIDVGVGGSSLMLGALAGGVISGLASLAATYKPSALKVKGVPVSGKFLVAGPVKNLQFAFVVLGRLLAFQDVIQRRTHADRSVVTLPDISIKKRIEQLSRTDQVKLTRILGKAGKGLTEKELLQLTEWIMQLQTGGDF